MDSIEFEDLQRRLKALEEENARLKAQGIAVVSERRKAESALAESEERYRTLFNSIDEGFCIIEFFDGPHGPLSDYVHVEANPAYTQHAGIPNVVGQKVREMVPEEADGWVELYGGVLRTGVPIRFERELVATRRHLELAAFRVEPANRKQVAVLFQDITKRKRAEEELQRLNETLEARVVAAVAERKLLADIVEGTNAFVQVVDPDFRWLAINGASAKEFHRIYGIMPKVGDNMLELLKDQPEHRDAIQAVWSRALAGEEFVEIGEFGDQRRVRRSYEMRFNALRDGDGRLIGAYQFVYDVTERLREQARLREALSRSKQLDSFDLNDGPFMLLRPKALIPIQTALKRLGLSAQVTPNGLLLAMGDIATNNRILTALGVAPEGKAPRVGEILRDTKETRISVQVNLDQAKPVRVHTGVGFFDHMLDQVATHGGFSLQMACEGDLEIDAHHTVEDCMLAFGQALKIALGDRVGMARFGFVLPMDETEAKVSIDLGGRPFCVFKGEFQSTHIGDYQTEMTAHAFRSLSETLGASIHVEVSGGNDHHKTEACFKALGRALRQATRIEGDALPSTKGMLA